MVKKFRRILLLFLILGTLLTGAGCWLTMTSSGAFWLLTTLGRQETARIEVADLQGSLLQGLDLYGVSVVWPGGRLSGNQLFVQMGLADLLQRKLLVDLLQARSFRLKTEEGATGRKGDIHGDTRALIPELAPYFANLGGWSGELRQVEIYDLVVEQGTGAPQHLKELSARLYADAREGNLSVLAVADAFGRLQGSLNVKAVAEQLNGEVRWQPPRTMAALEVLEAQFSLTRGDGGRLRGPIKLKVAGNGALYRLVGDLQLGRNDLRLAQLKFGRDKEVGAVRGELALAFQPGFNWSSELTLVELNLKPELGRATRLSGSLDLKGTRQNYSGRADLRNLVAGWEELSLASDLKGNLEELVLSSIKGAALGGELSGNLTLNWQDGFRSAFDLAGKGLELEQLPDGPEGEVDLELKGWLQKEQGQALQLGGTAQIPRGQILQRELHGELSGVWLGGRQLRLDRLDLAGGWGKLQAHGNLQQRLDLELNLRDAAHLWPDLDGTGELQGWLAWAGDWPHGQLTGELQDLQYKEWRIGRLKLEGRQPHAGAKADVTLDLQQLHKGAGGLDAVGLSYHGLPGQHSLLFRLTDGDGRLSMEVNGGGDRAAWHGEVLRFGLDIPNMERIHLRDPVQVTLSSEGLRLSNMFLQGDRGGQMKLSGEWGWQAGRRRLAGEWRDFGLDWLGFWLSDMQISGQSSGELSYAEEAGRFELGGQLQYQGLLQYAGQKLQLRRALIDGHWNSQGVAVTADLTEAGGGTLKAFVGSAPPQEGDLPASGNYVLKLRKFPLGVLNALLPAGQQLSGALAAELTGDWRGKGFGLNGQIDIGQGLFRIAQGDTRLDFPFTQARARIDWQQDLLQSRVSLDLGGGDELSGTLELQLPSRWPIALQDAPLAGEFEVQLEKPGLLTLLAPRQLAGLQGDIRGTLHLGGTLGRPDFSGELLLTKGQLSLPQLGIKLERIRARAEVDAQRLKLSDIEVHSGDGQLNGEGEVHLVGWKPQNFRIDLRGEEVLIANLPELRAVATPQLSLSGDDAGVTLKGLLRIPELQLVNWHPVEPLQRSADLVYVDSRPVPPPARSIAFLMDLEVELGPRVVVKERGLDVRLEGKVHLIRPPENGVQARGQIDIADGHYSAYGVKLPITQGRLFFNGGAADNPALDIIASKKIAEVTAGVFVGGTAREPEIRLISEPALDDTEILSYIVLGRPVSGGSADLSALSLASAALLSASDSASLQQKLQIRSGFDVIDVQPGEEGSFESSVITVGKYLTPELYLSYGRALSSDISQVQLRYSPSDRVDIESQFGEVSGADIYYKYEFP